MMHKKVGGLTRKSGAGGAAIALALGLAPAGVGLAGCGEDPATADDVVQAMVAEQKNSNAKTLQSVFEDDIRPTSVCSSESYKLEGGFAAGGYTLTVCGSSGGLTLNQTLSVYNGTENVSYTPVLKQTKGLTGNAYSCTLYNSGNVGSEEKAEFAYQIFNNRTEIKEADGTITLVVTPTEASVLWSMENGFESNLKTAFGSLSNFWTDTPFNGTWTQTDAKYTAAATVLQVASITLPLTNAAWTASATGTGNTAGISGYTITGITAPGTLTRRH